MTPEELDRHVAFVLEQQSRFDARMDRLAERQEAFLAELEVFKASADTALEVATQAAEVTARLADRMEERAEAQARADARIERLAVVVNELAGIVGRHVREGHGGNGSGAQEGS
jgi:alkylation response protein AidB-like acyl-CoA dehydrogenase